MRREADDHTRPAHSGAPSIPSIEVPPPVGDPLARTNRLEPPQRPAAPVRITPHGWAQGHPTRVVALREIAHRSLALGGPRCSRAGLRGGGHVGARWHFAGENQRPLRRIDVGWRLVGASRHSGGARYGQGMEETTQQRVEEVVQVPGAALWTVSQGSGLPLVLCHGGPGLSDNLGLVAGMVDDRALVHRYDQRGSGRSRSGGPFDVPSFIADLEALREHWGHERWVVGGHSWGANLALFYALAHPKRTRGVIYLAGTGLRWGWQDESRNVRLSRLTDDERAELEQLEQALALGDPSAQERFLRLMWTTDFADRSKAEVLDEHPLYDFTRNEKVFRAVSESYKGVLEMGVEEKVHSLDVPLLVLHGAQDTDPSRARRVAELAPRGQWAQLPNAAHCPWLEQPAPMRERLRSFLADGVTRRSW